MLYLLSLTSTSKCLSNTAYSIKCLGLTFNTKEIIMFLPMDKGQAIKTHCLIAGAKWDCWDWQILHPLQFWLRGTYESPANLFRPLNFTPEVKEALLFGAHLCCNQNWYIGAPVHHNRCLNRGLGGSHEQPDLQRQMVWKEGQINLHKSPRARDSLKNMSMAQKGDQGKGFSFQIDNATAVTFLMKECSTHCKNWMVMQERSCSNSTRTEWWSVQNTSRGWQISEHMPHTEIGKHRSGVKGSLPLTDYSSSGEIQW